MFSNQFIYKNATYTYLTKQDFLPTAVSCPMNMEYNPKASGCPVICGDTFPCKASRRYEGCECEEGFHREGDRCIPEENCGVVSEGLYFKVRVTCPDSSTLHV